MHPLSLFADSAQPKVGARRVEWGGDREALRGWDEGRWLLQGRRPGSALWLHLPWGRPELRMTWEGLPVSGGGWGGLIPPAG